MLINLNEIKIEPQTVRRASPLISTQSDARPGAAHIIGGIMPKTEWPRECPIGRGVTGVMGKRQTEADAYVVMVCDWDTTEQTKMPYARAEELRLEICRRWRQAVS